MKCYAPPWASHFKSKPPPKNTQDADHPDLIRWSIKEVRQIANKLAQRRIQPAYIIAWSCWRRAHQAAAQCAHIKSKMQL